MTEQLNTPTHTFTRTHVRAQGHSGDLDASGGGGEDRAN